MTRAVAERQDRAAFAEIFDYYVPRIEAYLVRGGFSASEAEDVAQDVMATFWRKAGMFDPAKSALTTWLYRIARNRRIDLARRNRVEVRDPQSPDFLDIADDAAPDAAIDGQRREDKVRTAMLTLPEEQKRLVALAFYEGLSHGEIAAATGIPLGTVKSRLRLAFGRMRKALEAAGIENAG